MSIQQQLSLAHLDTQAFALMSRLHVTLRRECGRITDIEYMRQDPAYCKHVLDIAERMPNETLPAICARLREIFFGTDGLFVTPPPNLPLVTRLTGQGMTTPIATQWSETSDSMREARPATRDNSPVTPMQSDASQAYVGRLR